MKNTKKCFAIDYSGSTFGEDFYHTNVKSILDAKYKNEDDIIIWDSSAKFISYNEYLEINKKKKEMVEHHLNQFSIYIKTKKK